MRLKAKINGVVYDVAQGAVFSDELNETLDSGSIIIDQVPKISGLRPYDDVHVWDASHEWVGYGTGDTAPKDRGFFYRHLLIDQYTETRLSPASGLYKYAIDLFSETKRLEMAQLPNITITQPLKGRGATAYDAIRRLVRMADPGKKISKGGSGSEWVWARSIRISPRIREDFSSIPAPEMSLTTPSLRDALTQIMLTRDQIPTLKDGWLTGLDIGSQGGGFSAGASEITAVIRSRSSSNFATDFRHQHQQGLGQEVCRRVEHLGFRYSDDGILTLSNMRVETSFPIYKVTKMLMCYYKKVTVGGEERFMLIKQDITPLVMLNQARNLLSKDWDDFGDNPPQTIDDMARYRMCTVGYDIGSRFISGWGEKYSYPKGWWTATKTYLENISVAIDKMSPLGIYSASVADELFGGGEIDPSYLPDGICSPFGRSFGNGWSVWLKSFFFEVEYQAFFAGAVVDQKPNGDRDGVVSNDSPSSALSDMASEGSYQRNKAARIGNEAVEIHTRAASPDDAEALGSVYEGAVIFHRQATVYDGLTQIVYQGTEGYAVRDYFTSVWSQIRPYQLADYSSAVGEAITKRVRYVFSNARQQTVERDGVSLGGSPASFLTDTPKLTSVGFGDIPECVNGASFSPYGSSSRYASDVNVFTYGTSVCLNARMRDNLGMGNWISSATPWETAGDDEVYAGSKQSWYSLVDENGELRTLKAYFTHAPSDDPRVPATAGSEDEVTEIYNWCLFSSPEVRERSAGGEKALTTIAEVDAPYDFKDGKQWVDLTVQIELLGEGVTVTPWAAKLTDWVGSKRRISADYTLSDQRIAFTPIRVWDGYTKARYFTGLNHEDRWKPLILMDVPEEMLGDMGKLVGLSLSGDLNYGTATISAPSITAASGSVSEGTAAITVSDGTTTATLNQIRGAITGTAYGYKWGADSERFEVGEAEAGYVTFGTMSGNDVWEDNSQAGWGVIGTSRPQGIEVGAFNSAPFLTSGASWSRYVEIRPKEVQRSDALFLPGFSADITYRRNLFAVRSKSEVAEGLASEAVAESDLGALWSPSSVFWVNVPAQTIAVNPDIWLDGSQSVQLWYRDDEGDGLCHLVFAANKSDITSNVIYWARRDCNDMRVFYRGDFSDTAGTVEDTRSSGSPANGTYTSD